MEFIYSGNKDTDLNKINKILRRNINFGTKPLLAKEYLPKKYSSKLENQS